MKILTKKIQATIIKLYYYTIGCQRRINNIVAYFLKHMLRHSAWNKWPHGVESTVSGYIPVNTTLHTPQQNILLFAARIHDWRLNKY